MLVDPETGDLIENRSEYGPLPNKTFSLSDNLFFFGLLILFSVLLFSEVKEDIVAFFQLF